MAVYFWALCVGTGLLAGCSSSLPSLENRSTSTALLDTGTTKLGKAIAPLVDAHPGKSGVYPLAEAHDAFAARALLGS
jgi:putative cardiolipin synthase